MLPCVLHFFAHLPICAGLDGDLNLVHPRIAAPVAEALGVASRRRLLLAASADCLALGLAGAGGAVEAFGQSEALTTRLRHIIQVGEGKRHQGDKPPHRQSGRNRTRSE